MRLHSPLVLTVLLTTHLTAANITPQPPPPQPQQQTIPVGNKKPSLFSQLTFRNLNPTLNLGAKRPLEDADLPSLPWGTAEAAAAFERQYDALGAVGAADKPNAAGLALYRAFGNEFVVSGLVKLLSDSCQLAAPLLLKTIIGQLEAGVGVKVGAKSTLALLLVGALQALALRHYFAMCFSTGLKVKASIVGATYNKLLRLAPAARLGANAGEVTNLMGPDAQRIGDLVPYLHALWFAPLQVLVALALLYREVGAALLPGFGVILLMLAANKWIAQQTYKCQAGLLRARDGRVKLVRELLTCIKTLKLHGWEGAFGERVGVARTSELDASAAIIRLRSLLAAVFASTPMLVAVTMLGMHVALGHRLSLKSAMTVLAAVNLLRSPLLFLPLVLQAAQEARTSLGRMQSFLNANEARVLTPGPLRDVGVLFDGVDLFWPLPAPPIPLRSSESGGTTADAAAMPPASDDGLLNNPDAFMLKGLHFTATRGELVALVGAVGSGKTAVLAALTGALEARRGSVHVRGSIAYAAQRPFILSASVRENILFGRPYDEERYSKVVHACALATDLADLAAGDQTQIGERGFQLSGGQRARISLARAAYSDAQIILLDDPLAAVDGAVARHLMSECIGPNGWLSDRVVLMATNALERLQGVPRIALLSNGELLEEGSFEQLSQQSDGAFAKLLDLQRRQHAHEDDENAGSEEAAPTPPASDPPPPPPEAAAPAPGLVSSISSYFSPSAPPPSNPAATETMPDDAPSAAAPATDAAEAATEGIPADGAPLPPQPSDGSEQWAAEGDAHLDAPIEASSDAVDPVAMDELVPPPDEGSDSTEADDRAALAAAGDEERMVGVVDRSVLNSWLEAAGGWNAAPRMLLPLIGSELLQIGSSWYLTRWASRGTTNDAALGARQNMVFLFGYAAWALAASILVVIRSRTILALGLKAGSRMHDDLLNALTRAPLRFFDTTPIGRLLARFSREMLVVDVNLPSALQSAGSTIVSVLSALSVVIVSSPAFLLAVIPLAYAYYAFSVFYMASSRELKRLESMSRAPLLTHVSETLDGLETIRAYGAQPRFSLRAGEKLDRNVRAAFVSCIANCWLGLRLELLGATLAAAAAMLAFAANKSPPPAAAEAAAAAVADVFGPMTEAAAATATAAAKAAARGAAKVGRSALGLSLAMQVTQALNWSVRQATELEANLVAVERMRTYKDVAPEPGYWAAPQQLEGEGKSHVRGRIELRNVGLRYREDLPLVLDGLDVVIQPSEKVGVVGRTGSGKSSLLMALTRLVAPPLRTGLITLDGTDISELPLLPYRSTICVIPQEPTLFDGTVRFNLDPLNKYNDMELWTVLQRVQLAHSVRLEDTIVEDGANLSAGQRQLLCIARALLAQPSVLIMDEATSAVDAETDAFIQRVVRAEFRDATVITIAHRLNTILDADKVLVLAEGKVAEFGPPKQLIGRSGGIFREMVQTAHAS